MATNKELKQITRARLRTVNILINAKDWDGAAYMMGYVLECALKAVTCKTLHLLRYPESSSDKKISKFFKTHDFDVLLTVSGLEDLFGFNGLGFLNWSEFTKEYQGNWTEMRYDTINWDDAKVKKVYNHLIEPVNGLITLIKRRKRW